MTSQTRRNRMGGLKGTRATALLAGMYMIRRSRAMRVLALLLLVLGITLAGCTTGPTQQTTPPPAGSNPQAAQVVLNKNYTYSTGSAPGEDRFTVPSGYERVNFDVRIAFGPGTSSLNIEAVDPSGQATEIGSPGPHVVAASADWSGSKTVEKGTGAWTLRFDGKGNAQVQVVATAS